MAWIACTSTVAIPETGAILPASLTLVKKHDGEEAAGDDALGAVAGSLGLIAFGVVVWRFAGALPAWLVLAVATAAWLGLSIALWLLARRVGRRPRRVAARTARRREQQRQPSKQSTV